MGTRRETPIRSRESRWRSVDANDTTLDKFAQHHARLRSNCPSNLPPVSLAGTMGRCLPRRLRGQSLLSYPFPSQQDLVNVQLLA